MTGRAVLRSAAGLPWRAMGVLGLRPPGQSPVAFVVERKDWSIRWDGIQICNRVNQQRPGLASITSRPERIVNGIAHFGSQFMWEIWAPHIPARNKVVVTYFHGKPEDGPEMAGHVDALVRNINRIDHIVVANAAAELRLRDWGFAAERISLIPIGVDTTAFRPPSAAERAAARQRFGIPDGRLAIGSFQKDGVGWADGLEPKLIKGPDLLLDAVGKLARHFPLHVLLTGPARGYVKRGLDALGIPYSHEYLQDYRDLPNAYHALDLYLVTSREEGGPKAVLEGAATGIPVVSSRVGMAPDVIAHGHTGCLVDVGDTTATVTEAAALLGDADLRMAVGAAARSAIAPYDWSHIGDRHLERVYTPLLDGTTS